MQRGSGESRGFPEFDHVGRNEVEKWQEGGLRGLTHSCGAESSIDPIGWIMFVNLATTTVREIASSGDETT